MRNDARQFRELLFTLVRRDLIVRYQSSVLGFLWSFAKPLALVAIFHFAFKVILRVGSPSPDVSFALHLLIGILVWSFFSRCIAEGHFSVLSHANLIKKVKLAVAVFPATTVVGNLVNFLLGMAVVLPVIFIMLSDNVGFSWLRLLQQVVGFCFLTGLVTVFAFALTLIVSALHVFYRDVESITEVGLTAWFYATPIVYPMNLVIEKFDDGTLPAWFAYLYWLNPMTPIVAAYRRVLLYTPPHLEAPDKQLVIYILAACIEIALLLVVAQKVFAHFATRFADEV